MFYAITCLDKSNSNAHLKPEELQDLFSKFCQQLKICLQVSDLSDLIYFLDQTESINYIIKFPYEILVTLVTVLDKSTENKKESYYCNKVLYYLAIYCEPSELIVYLIEQIKISKSYHCFGSLLNALKISLLRCKNILNVIDMIVDVVKKFVLHLTIISTEQDSESYDNSLEFIIKIYINLSNFVDNLITELLLQNNIINIKLQRFLLDCLLSLYDKPICLLNMDRNNQQLIFQKIVKNILIIESDAYYTFRYFNYGFFNIYNKFSVLNANVGLDCSLTVTNLSLCNFLWTILYTTDITLVQIYNPYYIICHCIKASSYLISLKNNTNIVIYKAFDIADYGLKFTKSFLLPFEVLDLPFYKEFIQNLINIIVFNNTLKLQQYALCLLTQFIHAFQMELKYIIIKKIILSNEHSKIKSIMIKILKDILVREIVTNKKIYPHKHVIYWNKSLEILISTICCLENGAETDLLQISDELTTMLNFIIFLIISTKNSSETKNCFENIKCNLLLPIKNILPIQKHQCMAKLIDLKENEKYSNINDKNNDCFDRKLSFVPFEQKIQLYDQALNTLLLIENILSRINELMDKNVHIHREM